MCGPSQLDATRPRGVEHRGCGKLLCHAARCQRTNTTGTGCGAGIFKRQDRVGLGLGQSGDRRFRCEQGVGIAIAYGARSNRDSHVNRIRIAFAQVPRSAAHPFSNLLCQPCRPSAAPQRCMLPAARRQSPGRTDSCTSSWTRALACTAQSGAILRGGCGKERALPNGSLARKVLTCRRP